ncbi:MAG: hypothetical protein MZU84_03220 [Sphingobacterium sp.]|nr:hypothetical protein [Sphingobacterium sp.]
MDTPLRLAAFSPRAHGREDWQRGSAHALPASERARRSTARAGDAAAGGRRG